MIEKRPTQTKEQREAILRHWRDIDETITERLADFVRINIEAAQRRAAAIQMKEAA